MFLKLIFCFQFFLSIFSQQLECDVLNSNDHSFGSWQFENKTEDRRLSRSWIECKKTLPIFNPLHYCHKTFRKSPKIANWKPDKCFLPEFKASEFWQALGNRNLLIVGDSLQVQVYANLRCELERGGLMDKQYKIVFGDSKHRFENSISSVEQASKFGNSDSNRMKTEQLKNDEFGKRKNGAGGVAIRLASDRGQTVDDTTVPQVDLFVTPTLFERYSPEKINNQSRLSVLDFFNASTAVWLPTSRIERKRTILYISVGAWFSQATLHRLLDQTFSEEETLFIFEMTLRKLFVLLRDFEGWVIFRSLSRPHRGCSSSGTHYDAGYSWETFDERDEIVRRLVEAAGGAARRFVFLSLYHVSDRRDAHPGAVDNTSKDCLHYCNPGPSSPVNQFTQTFLQLLKRTPPPPP